MPAGPDEVVAGPPFLAQRGLAVGDRITLEFAGRRVSALITGESIGGNAEAVEATWAMRDRLAPGTPASDFTVTLAPGADAQAYAAATTIVTFSVVFTVLLATVAALGVFNTVLLTTRERRRELGMLKAIGMTPRQVTVLAATSVTVLSGLLAIPPGSSPTG